MKNMIKLVNNHTLFVEGATDRVTAFNILEESTDQSPLGMMFSKGGTIQIHTLNVPFRKLGINDPHITCRPMTFTDGTEAVSGVGISVPDDALRLHSAWIAARDGVKYNWNTFLAQYMGDLEKIGSLMFSHADTTTIDGMQAQAITSPLVGEDEVGLNATTMRKFHKSLINNHPELEGVETLEGMWVLLQGYPVVSQHGGRWVKLVMLKGAPSDKILVNAKTWMEKHDRDEDGDGAYLGIGTTAVFGEVSDDFTYPEVVTMDRDDLPEVKVGNAVSTVMNMLARDLIGSQHSLFHGLARAAAVRCHSKGLTPEDSTDRFDRATKRVFEVYHPLAEGTFNARKIVDGIRIFKQIVKENESHLKGGRVNAEAYYPLLTEELQRDLKNTLELTGGTTAIAKHTAFGRLLTAGSNNLPKTFGPLMDDMLSVGVAKEDLLRALQADALGEKILRVPMPKATNRKSNKKKWELKLDVANNIDNIKTLFENITYLGKSVFKVVGMAELEDGCIEVGVALLPNWRQNLNGPVISIVIPKITKVDGTEHHRLLNLPRMQTRMFCPIYRMEGDAVMLVDLKLWFAEVVARALESFSKRMGKDIDKNRLQNHMDRATTKAVRDLQIITSDEQGIREKMIRMFEYRVEINDKDTISGKWAQRERILTLLSEMGMDVSTTSKNKPGTIVTKAWKAGVPRFVWAMNPFASQLDMKRRVEVREIRKALELANPIMPPLKTMGAKLPEVLAKCVTVLNVAFMDIKGWNVFDGTDGDFCFDTLLVTESGVDKLAVKNLGFHAIDAEEKNRIISKLLKEGFTNEQIKVEEMIDDLGGGLCSVAYDIAVVGPINDIGKIKGCVGPIKGVMNPVPFKLFSEDGTEIDIIVPHDTMYRKAAVDALNYMMAAKAGMTEIDPDNLPTMEVTKNMVMLENNTVVGEAITGPLPFFRPNQTGRSTSDMCSGANGVKVHCHTMIMSKGVDTIKFNTSEEIHAQFAEIVAVRDGVLCLAAEWASMEGMDAEDYAVTMA